MCWRRATRRCTTPPDDVVTEFLTSRDGVSVCEWKGRARSWDARVGQRTAARAAWGCSHPKPVHEE
ncbi:DUF427 domain-containing protein [Kitasatospora sp. NPDC058263]